MLNRIIGLLTVLALTACVTINIYFPAAAAEEAARINRARRAQERTAGAGTSGESRTTSSLTRRSGHHWPLRRGDDEALVAPAQAAQADININTAAISAIRARYAETPIQPGTVLPRSGVVCSDNRARSRYVISTPPHWANATR